MFLAVSFANVKTIQQVQTNVNCENVSMDNRQGKIKNVSQ
jgi:hypothetical protein